MSLSIALMSAAAGTSVFVCRLLLAATVIWILAAAVTLLLRRSSASLRHRIWSMSMAAAFAMPPLVALAPQWEVAHYGQATVGAAAATPQAIARKQLVDRMPAVSSTATEYTEPDARLPLSNAKPQVDDGAHSSAQAAQPSVIPSLHAPAAPAEVKPLHHNIPWLGCLAGLWLAVALWLLVRQVASLVIAAAVVRRAPVIGDGAACHALTRHTSRLSLSVQPFLRQSDEIRTPICVGYIRPCIVLPMDHVHWDNDQLAAALTHELAHVVRRDVAWQTLARLACAAWWFHPLAWYGAWRMRVERELACDDWVLHGGESSTRYARWLVAMAASLAGPSRPAERVGVAMARPHGFHTRLSAILDPRRRRASLSRRATLLLAMSAGALLMPLAVMNPFAPRHATAATPPPTTQPTLPASQPVAPAATQPADDSEGPRRSLRVKFVDAVTREPVPGVRGSYWSDRQRSSNIKLYTSDEHGESTFTFAADAQTLSFFVHKASFVEGSVTLGGEFGTAPLSESYTLRLRHGLTVGGIVQDEQGNGVADAKVQISFEFAAPDKAGGLVGSNGSATTDAQGRWTYDGAPTQPGEFRIFTSHPDFVLNSFDHGQYGSGRFSDLLAGRLVSVIRRGVSVAGNAVDPEGRPVPRAEIAIGGFGLISGTYTDEHGHFVLRGVEPGPRDIAARVEGFAPQLKSLDVVPGIAPVEIRFDKGRVLRVRVVDPQGKAVPSANVVVRKWRNVDMSGTNITADSGSRFVWDNAPADEVMLSVGCSRDLFQPREVAAVAGDNEVVVTLTPHATLRLWGSVVDDQTGQPIDRFSVHVSARQGKVGYEADRRGHAGTYELSQISDADSFQIRISADGYLPSDSPELKNHDGLVQFDARLKKGGGITGSIFTPDSKPAAGADVVLIEHLAPSVEDGMLTSSTKRANISTVTDAAGHFMLPPRNGPMELMLIHDTGWSFIKIGANESLEHLRLRAWCELDGILMKGDKPWPGQTIELRPTLKAGEPIPERRNFRYSTTTDSEGKFKIARVIDGTADIGRELVVPMEGGGKGFDLTHGVPLNLKPGESKSGIQIGGIGRPVIAHVIVSDDLKAKGLFPVDGWLSLARPPAFVRPPNWDSLSEERKKGIRRAYEQTDVYQRYENSVKRIGALVTRDGTLRIEDVPSGDYTLYVVVERRSPDDPTAVRAAAKAELKVTVSDMPGGRSGEPLDVGSLALGIVQRPKPGELAPKFEPADFNKGHIKLSDYQGKYVLLDFWATWCGPCIAELMHMEKLNQTYANDPRFVMIGVSVDDRIDDPSRFLQDRKLPWPQAYGGPTAWTTFGIGAIPSVWLIGPDGKIIAKEIPEEDLDRVVQQALLQK